jgi:hypothetical protein
VFVVCESSKAIHRSKTTSNIGPEVESPLARTESILHPVEGLFDIGTDDCR